ncbi:MAG TPA: polyphenol oxidase family protein [Candidatus Polarisedimenticolia bacterium]|nr:polyphenol oxidase family protein [Candidatus Polarisedimenticolia bacterium]
MFRHPAVDSARGVAGAWIGRAWRSRPAPADLLPLVARWPQGPPPLAVVRQVHSSRWVIVREAPAAPAAPLADADAILTARRGIALGVATADCLPIVAVDPEAPALAVVHAGWRGTLAGVLRASLEAMAAELGANPARILVAAGPAAGACCYQVGEDLATRFAAAWPDAASRIVRRDRPGERPRLDLMEANRLQALEAGVPEHSVHSVDLCTICRPEGTHSYRRDGAEAGRMWLLAALTGRAGGARDR